jgi:hypothetical protein
MRRSRTGRNGVSRTVYTDADDIGFWMQADDHTIHLTIRGIDDGHVRISNDPTKTWGHPRLYNILAKALQATGAPSPLSPPEQPNRRAMVEALRGRGVGALSEMTDAEVLAAYTAG